jgi:hypothetical protein
MILNERKERTNPRKTNDYIIIVVILQIICFYVFFLNN